MTQEHSNNFGIQQVQQTALQETATASRAASATAMIQARCVMAIQRPRDWDTVRAKLLHECERPGFAEVAIYRKPVGGGKTVEGHSIRFAEAAARYLSNFHTWSETIHEDEHSLTMQVTAMDLETNVTVATEVLVQKTVERTSDAGRLVYGERTNSWGKPVFIVAATEDEVVTKTNALLSKARRNLIMQLLPGDIADECEAACRATQKRNDKKDPDAAKKKLFDAFSKYGITPSQIKAHLGHNNPPTPAELESLRGIYSAISTGETTWAAVTEDLRSEAEKQRAAVIDSVAEPPAVSIPAAKPSKTAREPGED